MLIEAGFRWLDPKSWPWVVWVWLAMLAAGWVKPAWNWLQKRRAESWSSASGRIESTEVSRATGVFGLKLGRSDAPWYARLAYSYSVAGERYSGEYKREVGSEAEGLEFTRDLDTKPVVVHYDPANPATSVLLEPAVEAVQNLKSPAPPTRTEDSPLIPRPILWVLVWISAAGLILSICVHVLAIMGHEFPEVFWGLHVGIFVVWIPTVIVLTQQGNARKKDFWKRAMRNAPAWMKYMMEGFFVYAFVNFMLFFGKTFGVNHHEGGPADWRGFSGHWMAFYSAALGVLYSAASSGADQRCLNGHSVSANTRFCPKCGQPVVVR